MLPWVYEFQWSFFHITFLLVFFTVFSIVVATLAVAFKRTRRAEIDRSMEAILWHSDFEDLSPAMKQCRHVLSGEVQHRVCDHAFDCRTCPLHPVLAARRTKTPLLQFESYGFTMPPYRLYHRGHTWVQEEDDGTMKVGIDDFGRRLIGRKFSVELPPVGTHLSVNGKGMLVKNADSTFRILSPIDGTVLEQGDTEKGWFLRIQPDNTQTSTAHLLKGDEVPNWLMKEMERLQISFSTGGVGVTLADGGELVPDFQKQFPTADWDGVVGQMFLQA